MEDNWVQSIGEKIDKQLQENISVRDSRFYQIGKLKKIAFLLDRHETCLDCKYAKSELESIVGNLDRLINKSGVNRGEYERRVEKLIKHLKDSHQIYQPHHFTYTYSAIYSLVGTAFGLLVSYGFFYGFDPTTFFLCSGTALFVGNVLGARKDRERRRKGKQI